MLITALLSCSSDRKPADLLPGEAAGWSRSDSTVIYDRQTIFDYIDGAGEVYLSYGFTKVVVTEYRRTGHPNITVELFDMGSPADAWGVFSYARESEAEGIGNAYEFHGSVLCFWQAHYFVCVAADELTDSARAAIPEFARQIAGGLPLGGEPPALLKALPEPGRVVYSERYFHTHQPLNYHYYLSDGNLLQLGTHTDAVLARYEPGTTVLLCVKYRNADEAAAALAAFIAGYLSEADGGVPVKLESGKWVAARQSSRSLVIVFDAESSDRAVQLRDDALNLAAGLDR